MTAGDGASGGAPAGTAEEALETARAFIDAIVWGEHHRIWELMAHEGRVTVLRIAATRGMDQQLATRLRDDSATPEEKDEFLTDLLNGLRADLAGNDLDALEYSFEPDQSAPARGRAALVAPLPEPLSMGGGLPVGTLEMVHEGGRWRVERLALQFLRPT